VRQIQCQTAQPRAFIGPRDIRGCLPVVPLADVRELPAFLCSACRERPRSCHPGCRYTRARSLIWINGGNAFPLRRAMRQSGFDEVAWALLASDEIVYVGFSAATCCAGSYVARC